MSNSQTPVLTVVSHSFPPRVSASAILMTNLLSHYSGKLNAVGGFIPWHTYDSSFRVPCTTQILRFPRLFPRTYVKLRKINPSIACWSMKGPLRRSLLKCQPNVILGVYPFADLFVQSFLSARALHLPFYAYMNDLWAENMTPGTGGYHFAQKWEGKILREANRVLCVTESMQNFYEKKYGIKTELLPHCVPDHNLVHSPVDIYPAKMDKPTVLFSGGVNEHFNLDALKTLVAALELLPQHFELLFCTHITVEKLKQLGLTSKRLRVKHVSREELQQVQSKAHVLIAPLSHNNCASEQVRVLFSTKLLNYMLTGRPIVVFAPQDSFHAESAKKKGWGYVVTQNSPSALASAIVKVMNDETLSRALVHGAIQEARSRSATQIASRLFEWVEADTKS